MPPIAAQSEAAVEQPLPAPDDLPPGSLDNRTPVVVGQPQKARHHHARGDPFEGVNRASYDLSKGLDRALFRPAALGYRHIMPKPARDGLRNFLANMGEPFVFLNDMLQLKPGRALRTVGRFVINSTLGVAGLIDTAKRKPFHLPHHDNSLGDTLGFYGIGPGPYLYLPVLGPTTLRDVLAGSAQSQLHSAYTVRPFNSDTYKIPRTVFDGLDQRAEADEDLRALNADAVDPYATLRSVFLQDRQGEIDSLKAPDGAIGPEAQDADPAAAPLDNPLVDPAAPDPAPTAPIVPK